ncbi:hypothetical protein L1049_020480 [Liquidambar formosana]|uniref:Uncharacterized protein n=1 Tax=Liquidambar formosana TaxID=63359 RepID=A0AAP0X7D4_LIQFO
MPKHGTHRDSRAAPVNGNKVWTRKPKLENHGGNLNSRGQKEVANQSAQNKNCEVLIGSISVTLGNSNGPQQSNSLAGARDDGAGGHPMPRKSNGLEKSIKPDAVQCGMTRSTIKLWRPVSRGETRGPTSVQSDNREPEVDVVTGKGNDVSSESCLRSCARNNNSSGSEKNSPTLVEETPCPGEGFCFSSQAAEAFLAQRWKEAIAADHVKLVLFPEPEPPGCPEIEKDCHVAAQPLSSDIHNRLPNVEAHELSSSSGTGKAKLRTKSEKGVKLKYIPKVRRIT